MQQPKEEMMTLTVPDSRTRRRIIEAKASLVDQPELANDPGIAAKILAAFLGSKEAQIRNALQADDLATARKLVNGGTHGLVDFTDAFQRGLDLIPDNVQVQVN